jgi:hypothetical protein
VGVAGRRDEALLAALEEHADSVAPVGSANPAPCFDVIVARDPSPAELAATAAALAPDGSLVIERTRRRGLSLGPATAGLARLGFRDVRIHWHWPDLERCTRVVPLDDPTSLRYALARAGTGARARLGAFGLRRLHEAGLLGLAVSAATVIARRATGSDGARSIVHRFLAERRDRLGTSLGKPARLPFVLLTPRFRNSSHLVFLLLEEGGRQPLLVAKLPREEGRSDAVEREAERLRAIHALTPGGFPSIPRVVAFEPLGERRVLVQSAMAGRPMDRAAVRRRPEWCCEALLAWLLEVHSASRSEDRPAAHIERDLDELGRLFPSERDLVAATRALVAPLAGLALPAVLEHRDLSHPNLVVGAGGELAVIDWEQAEPRGVPALDLFFALSYVAIARDGARGGVANVRAVERAFLAPGWARAYVARYARALVDPAALTPLFVAGWARQVAGLADRVGGAEPGSETAAWLARDWRFAAWRRAVERAREPIDWGVA